MKRMLAGCLRCVRVKGGFTFADTELCVYLAASSRGGGAIKLSLPAHEWMNEWMNEWTKNFIHVPMYLSDANWGHNLKIKWIINTYIYNMLKIIKNNSKNTGIP